MKNIAKMIAMIAAVFCVALAVPGSVKAADSTETTKHYFTQTTSTQKITWFVEGEKVVATASFGGRNLDYSKHYYEMKNDYTGLYFYRLKTDRSGIEKIPVYRDKVYTLQNGEWVLTYDGSESGYVSYSDLTYNTQYYDFTDSGIDILEFNMTDRGTVFNKGTMSMDYKSVSHSTETNIYSYLLNGTFTDFGKNYVLLLHENLLDIVPQMYRSYNSSISNSTVSISVDYDEENGIVSWSDFVVDEENTLKKGVIAAFYYSGDKGYNTDYYRTILTGTSYKISLGGCDFSDSTMRYSQITFIPYYIHTNGTLYFGKSSYITIDEDSVAATRSASKLLIAIAKSDDKPDSIVPDKGENSSDYWEEKWSVFTYDAGCFFNGFVTTNVYATMDMGLGGSKKTDVVASYLARWNSVSTTYSDRATNFIRVDLGCGSEWVTFSREYAYFSDPSVQFNSVELSNFIYKKWDNPQGSFCLRLTPYYTTRSGGSYYGKPVYFDFDIFGSIKSVGQYEGDFRDGNSYDFTDITQKDYFEDNSAFGDLFDDIFNDSGSSEDTPFSINDLTFNFFSLLKDLISACGQFPALIASVFSFLPSVYTSMLVVALGLVVILRIVGR